MIKNILSAFFSILLVNNAGLFGQLQPGFQPDEARGIQLLLQPVEALFQGQVAAFAGAQHLPGLRA